MNEHHHNKFMRADVPNILNISAFDIAFEATRTHTGQQPVF